uniref:Uncharacterized protein n=1 Tax=Lactuca sativa TaxID=4236 RepID=A0A9R1WZH5_LACSA|nr:hypothetical protein LSAT_V11C800419190 [Lactuca sativa]
MKFSLQTLKNKQSSYCRLQMFGPHLLLQRLTDVVRRLKTFWLQKNKQHQNIQKKYNDSNCIYNHRMKSLAIRRFKDDVLKDTQSKY